MKKKEKIPVLILAFNRPKLVQELLTKLEKSEISELFISIDGPRNVSDFKKADEILQTVKQFSEDIPIHIRRGQANLGCRLGVISGLDWFFNQVSGGLVLEDDCHPSEGFFDYLQTYRDLLLSGKIQMITAHNPYQQVQIDNYFSRYAFIHGWYMQSEAWREIRKEIFKVAGPQFASFKERGADTPEVIFWWAAYLRARIGPHNTWDSLFYRAFVENGFYCLVPRSNMVENHGFGTDATHTLDPNVSILIPCGPSRAKLLSTSKELDKGISELHFKIRFRHVITPLFKVFLDLIRIRKFPNYENQITKSQSTIYLLNIEPK